MEREHHKTLERALNEHRCGGDFQVRTNKYNNVEVVVSPEAANWLAGLIEGFSDDDPEWGML